MLKFEDFFRQKDATKNMAEIPVEDELTQVEKRLNAQDSTDSLIAAAIPAIAGALTGYGEEGLKYGAQAGMANEKEKSTLQNKLLELRNRRIATQAKNNKLYEVDANGETRYATPEQAVGQLVPKNVKTNLEDGKDRRQAVALEARAKEKMTDRQINAYNNFTKPQSRVSELRDNIETSIRGADILNEGGPVGESGLPVLIQKGVFGQGGVLSDRDISLVGGDQAKLAQLNRVIQRAMTGTLEPTDREDLYTLFKIAHAKETEKAQLELGAISESQRLIGNDIEKPLKAYFNFRPIPALGKGAKPARLQSAQERQQRAGQVPATPDEVVRQGGQIYRLNKQTGKYE